MNEYGPQSYENRMSTKIRIFFEGIWPTVYTLINDFIYGIINFFKFIFSGIFGR